MVKAPVRTAVLVLNYNGKRYLHDCFESLGRQDIFAQGRPGTPAQPEVVDEVWLVDNGSNDGSVEYVRERFPWVKILAFDQNRGFSQAYNRAAEGIEAQWLAFLNNDTRVAPDWLSQLHRCASAHPAAAAVASRIASWDGTRIDFVGANTFFFGQAAQVHQGEPLAGSTLEERRLLFGCGGALLVRRATFLEVGGFDPDYFSFFEDVDLGWRLNVAGYEVWFCPQALACHRGQGTWGSAVTPSKRFLLERNGLANAFKNWDDSRVGVFFLFAALVTFLRGLTAYGTPVPTYPPKLSSEVLAHLLALADLDRLLPDLGERRAHLARLRVRSDQELLPLFGSLTAAPSTGNRTFDRLYRWILWRCDLEQAEKLPEWNQDINGKALELGKTFARLCRAGCLPASLTPDQLKDWDLGSEHQVPLPLAQLVFRLRQTLEQFLARPLGVESLAWLDGQLATLHATFGTLGSTVAVTWEEPSVAVVIRTRNRPQFLEQALGSVAAQTRKPDEVVVVNDGGLDPSPVLGRFQPQLPLKLVTLSASRGRTVAAQIGLESATAVVICFLDDDDQWLPVHLETLLAALANGVRVAYADVEVLKTDGSGEKVVARGVLGGEFNPVRLLFENYIPIMAVVFPKELALSVGGFDTSLEYFEDWDLWLRLAQHEAFLHVPRVTARYFVRPALGHGKATAGDHRWPHMAKVFHKHRHLISGWAWVEYFREEVETTREQRNELAVQLESILRSRSWRAVQLLRRLARRA